MKRIILTLFLLLPNLAFAQITNQEVLNKISSNLPTNNANEINALLLRNALDYMTSAIFQGGPIPSGTGTCPPVTGLTTFQFYANTTAAPTGTTLNVFDSTNCVQWAILNQTAHTITGSFDNLSIVGLQGTGTTGKPGIITGESVATAASWLLNYTDPYGSYAWFIGQNSGGAVLAANHSADYNPLLTPAADLITHSVYAYHDNSLSNGYMGVWGNYWLAVRTETAAAAPFLFGLEATFLNSGANVQADPYNVSNPGLNVLMRLDSGLGVAHSNNIVTGAIEVANVGGTFYNALNVTTNALSPSSSGFYEAIQLASAPTGTVGPGHAIVWYEGTGPASISGVIETDASGVMRLHGVAGIQTDNGLKTLINTAASGTQAAPYCFSSISNFCLYYGTGAPSFSSAQASIYLQNDGGVYLNTNGSTAWDQFTSNTATQTLTNKTIAFASNTLTGVAPTASPTFTGTVIGPDSTTWTSSGWSSLTSVGAISGTNITGNTLALTAATPTVSAGQVGYGVTIHTAGSTNCPATINTSVSATQTVQGCLVINVAGTARQIPFFTSP